MGWSYKGACILLNLSLSPQHTNGNQKSLKQSLLCCYLTFSPLWRLLTVLSPCHSFITFYNLILSYTHSIPNGCYILIATGLVLENGN